MSRGATTGQAAVAPVPISRSVQLRMQRQRSRDTPIELRLRRILHARGLRFRVHRRPLPKLPRTADLVFGPARVAVHVDGCFWHGCPEHYMKPRTNRGYWLPKIEANQRRDADTDARLADAGWISFRVWEHEDMNDAADRLERVLAARRAEAVREH